MRSPYAPHCSVATLVNSLCLMPVLVQSLQAQNCVDYSSFFHAEKSISLPEGQRTGDDNHLYIVTDGGTLLIYDVDGPVPVELSSLVLPDGAGRLAVAAGTVLVASGVNGLQVVDVSNPQAPVHRITVDTPGTANHVAVEGTYAFVADGDALVVLDISTPANASIIGSVATTGTATTVRVSSSLAYVVDVGSIEMVDVSVPSAPTIVGSPIAPAWDILPQGTTAFLAGPTMSLIDVSNPNNLVTLGTVPEVLGLFFQAEGNYVARHGDFVFVQGSGMSGFNGVFAIDVSNPSSPVVAGVAPNSTAGLTRVSDKLLTPETVLMPLEPDPYPDPIGEATTSGNEADVAVRGDHAYVTNSGLQVFDVSNPATPTLVTTSVSGQEPFLDGAYLYLVDDTQLLILNLAAPDAPVQVGSVGIAGARDVAVVGTHAYVAATAGLVVVDVADRTNPMVQGSTGLLGGSGAEPGWHVAAVGDLAIVAGFTAVAMIDASDPLLPSTTWSQVLGGNHGYTDLTADGGFLYGPREHQFGTDIFDPTQPTNPRVSTVLPGSNLGSFATVSDGKLYVFAPDFFLLHIDVLDPAHPVVRTAGILNSVSPKAGIQQTSSAPHYGGIAVHDGLLFAVDSSGNMKIYAANCETTTSVEPGPEDAIEGRPALLGVWPNPMRTQTTISLSLPQSKQADVRVFDVTGHQIWHRSVLPGESGRVQSLWTGRNDQGMRVPSGVYFVQMQWEGGSQTRRVSLVR